jgi:TPR repeat protein
MTTLASLKRLWFGTAIVVALAAPPLRAQEEPTLPLAFMPPVIVPQDVCARGATPDPEEPTEDSAEATTEAGLTDEMRLRFIQRDIRNYQAADAARWFNFILSLIDWQTELDPDLAGTGATLARIALYIDAGRLSELSDLGLIDSLRHGPIRLTNAQRLAIAQFYLTGTGVEMDREFALSLIREAAFGGNPDALLSIARLLLNGEDVPEWDAPLDLTITLAFGGMLGQMNAEVCARAERIARHYLSGDIVTPNHEIALAWYRFAADLGGATAAWRIVEFHLEAAPDRRNNTEMLRYLRLAVDRGIAIDDLRAEQLRVIEGPQSEEIAAIIGPNIAEAELAERPGLARFLQLGVNRDAASVVPDSPYGQYLRELIQLETAPGFVFRRLASEILNRQGRWAGETEAMALLEEASRRGDPEGMRLLAQMLVRYRDDPARLNRAINLLMEAVDRHGLTDAMADLDAVYRCQVNEAPMLDQASHWADLYNASLTEQVTINTNDITTLDPFKDPETIVELQTQALRGVPTSLAAFALRVDANEMSSQTALRIWADRTDSSAKALEIFADAGFARAATPAERGLAVEMLRRVYLHVGVSAALELSVALIEDFSRDPVIAAEILTYLNQAGSRGEGAAIRLLARLASADQSGNEVYQTFAQVIDERGDFLALMFAIPHVNPILAADYMDRAVSIMTCGTKDSEELGAAYAVLGDPGLSLQWGRIALAIEGGNVLAKLGITDRQSAMFGTGAPPSAIEVAERIRAEGEPLAAMNLFDLTADPNLLSHDPEAAAGFLTDMLGQAGREVQALAAYRRASEDIRAAVNSRVDLRAIFLSAARRGDVQAAREYGLLLRDTATGSADLQESMRWLSEAAEAGDIDAMAAWGQALAFGLGTRQDRAAALVWLDRSARTGNAEAALTARLLRIEGAE